MFGIWFNNLGTAQDVSPKGHRSQSCHWKFTISWPSIQPDLFKAKSLMKGNVEQLTKILTAGWGRAQTRHIPWATAAMWHTPLITKIVDLHATAVLIVGFCCLICLQEPRTSGIHFWIRSEIYFQNRLQRISRATQYHNIKVAEPQGKAEKRELMGAGPNAAASHLPGSSWQHVATAVHPREDKASWKKMKETGFKKKMF